MGYAKVPEAITGSFFKSCFCWTKKNQPRRTLGFSLVSEMNPRHRSSVGSTWENNPYPEGDLVGTRNAHGGRENPKYRNGKITRIKSDIISSSDDESESVFSREKNGSYTP